ncbi:MAG: hypothetical protein ACK5LR_06780 [Mangrovibacterium sp.]
MKQHLAAKFSNHKDGLTWGISIPKAILSFPSCDFAQKNAEEASPHADVLKKTLGKLRRMRMC